MRVETKQSSLVASCGNVMAGDDAFGPLTTAYLRQMSLSQEVEVVDLDIKPAALLELLDRQELLILVDAAVSDRHPAGTLLVVNWRDPDRPQLTHDDALSSHGMGLGEQLSLAKTLGILPRQVFLVALIVDPPQVGDKPSLGMTEKAVRAAAMIQEIMAEQSCTKCP